jgi:protein-disulfide isomerase
MPDLIDIVEPVDHVRGRKTALVTLIEYGDFESVACRNSLPFIRALTAEFGTNIRVVFRHFPQRHIHRYAELAAEAAEAAGAQGRFWAMHDLLFANQDDFDAASLVRYAYTLGLNVDRFARELVRRVHREKVARDMQIAWASGVRRAPTFFLNGSRYDGHLSYDSLRRSIARHIQRDAEVLYAE